MPLLSTPSRFGAIRVHTPEVGAGRRIGLMGGSFNPPHEGHAVVAATALRRLRLDQVWWVVTPGNPLKSNGSLAPLAERMAACRQLARSPRMRVTAFEADLGTPYTAAMIAFLRLRHARTRFVWVMGADNLASFHRWQQWRAIARMLPIAVVDRPGWRYKALASPAARTLARCRRPEQVAGRLAVHGPQGGRWTYLSTRLSHASSTQLRGRAAARVVG
jgi:nicotinate-nucleotide adenylyltransferase